MNLDGPLSGHFHLGDMNYEDILFNDPGNPVFADYAEVLRKEGKLEEALQVCFRGLSRTPSCHLGRLVLARIFYQSSQLPFAIREIEQLCRELPELSSINRLLKALSPDSKLEVKAQGESAKSETPEKTIAEAEFDFDMIAEMESNDQSAKPKK